MSRRHKATVDYFPHYVNHKQTLYILEQKYGNDGYAVWFKTLELLGKTEGHYIACGDPAVWCYYVATARVDEEKLIEIMDLLCSLGAVDRELWTQHKIIWSQNFINELEALYVRRKIDLPQKPTSNHPLPILEDNRADLIKTKCRNVTNRAVRSGLINKHPCLFCGENNVEAHHEDYSDPFTVIWFCRQCHTKYHQKKKNDYINPAEPDNGMQNDYINPADDNNNPQSRVEERRGEESIKDICPSGKSPTDPPERKKKVKTLKNLESEALPVYEFYRDNVRSGGRADAIKSICRLLRDGKTTRELISYVQNYKLSTCQNETEVRYIIQANNFFGEKARWQEYLEPSKEQGKNKLIADLRTGKGQCPECGGGTVRNHETKPPAENMLCMACRWKSDSISSGEYARLKEK